MERVMPLMVPTSSVSDDGDDGEGEDVAGDLAGGDLSYADFTDLNECAVDGGTDDNDNDNDDDAHHHHHHHHAVAGCVHEPKLV